MKQKTLTFFIAGLLLLLPTTASLAQTTCATARDAVIGENQAPVETEFWYKFSVAGKPLANYYIIYPEKELDVDVRVYSGSCADLKELSYSIPAVPNDESTYYIRFTWRGTPQAFTWELHQSLVVLVSGIDVTPERLYLQLDETYNITNNITVNIAPENATNKYYDIECDNEEILELSTGYNKTIKAIGTGKANLIYITDDGGLKDTVQVIIPSSACDSAQVIQPGTYYTAQSIRDHEEWSIVTPSVSGIYQIKHNDVDEEGEKVGAGEWIIYEGTCADMRKCENEYLYGDAKAYFRLEAGKTYAIRYIPFYEGAFNWVLEAPVKLTGFSLTTKQLEFDLSLQNQQSYDLRELGLNFTPADATDKGVDIFVRDTTVIGLYEDGESTVYKDAITPLKGGSTYIVFRTIDGGFQDSCLVTVHDIPATGFSLTKKEATLYTPYNNTGNNADSWNISGDTLRIESLGLNFVPSNVTDRSYKVIVRNKSIVKYLTEPYGGKEYLKANREGSTYVVIETTNGNLRDSILVNVTRVVNAGAPCENAVAAQVGENAMPGEEYFTKWFTFTPAESGFYGMTNKTTKYPITEIYVYEGTCDELYLANDGRIMGGYNESGELYGYQFGFYAEAGTTYYIKAITQDFNVWGGGVIEPYVWVMHKLNASISGTVTDNGQPAEGKALLYYDGKGAAIHLLKTVELINGTYSFDKLGLNAYYVKIITNNGDVTYYGDTVACDSATRIRPGKSEALTGMDIQIRRKVALNEGTAKISGYITTVADAPRRMIANTTAQRPAKTNGVPAENTTVLLMRGEKVIAYTQTDSQGYFEFTGVGTGDYTVVVDIPGLKEDEPAVINVAEDTENIELSYQVSETGIEDISSNTVDVYDDAMVTVFPNPAKSHVQLKGIDQPTTISIYTIQGTKVLERLVQAENSIYIGNLPAGIYLIDVKGKVIKMMKE